jgi:hypothetical protein
MFVIKQIIKIIMYVLDTSNFNFSANLYTILKYSKWRNKCTYIKKTKTNKNLNSISFNLILQNIKKWINKIRLY